MGEHKTSSSKAFINDIAALGQSLDYHVEKEWPIPESGKPPQQVDVCWFRSPNDCVPLFTFEIESAYTASSSGNAIKLYSKPSSSLLKPLFFYHIYLDEREKTQRIIDLENQYSTHNYRIYTQSDNEHHSLISDILSQHERIGADIQIYPLLEQTSAMQSLSISPEKMYRLISRHTFLSIANQEIDVLVHLNLFGYDLGPELSTAIQRVTDNGRLSRYEHISDNIFSLQYREPILFSISAHFDSSSTREMARNTIMWQEESDHFDQIGPYWQLSRDYDDFVMRFSPIVWANTTSLLHDADLINKICGWMKTIEDKIPNEWRDYLPYHIGWRIWIASCICNTYPNQLSDAIDSWNHLDIGSEQTLQELPLHAPMKYTSGWPSPMGWMPSTSPSKLDAPAVFHIRSQHSSQSFDSFPENALLLLTVHDISALSRNSLLHNLSNVNL